jgi:hypothetical protein
MRSSRFLIAVCAVVGLTMISATSADAEERPPTPGANGYVDPNGSPTAVANDGSRPTGGGGGGGGGGDSPCHWAVVIGDDFEFSIYSVDTLETQHSATGRWLEYVCEGVGPVAVDGYFLIPEGGLVDPVALAAEALASIAIQAPAIQTSPSAEGRLYVRLPTWLWLDQSWWHTYEATAAAGRVTSTVKARPVRTTWATGDGDSVACAGPGRAWAPGLAEHATDCQHTYTTSSANRPGGTISLGATVTLEVSWTSNTGAGGTLSSISRTSNLDVEVGEIQAIGTQ